MGLDLGWYAGDVRDTIWKDDPALGPFPPDVLAAWEKDGAAAHLRPYAKVGEEPTVFTFRALTLREKGHVQSRWLSGMYSVYTEAFLVGVEFPGTADPIPLSDGTRPERYERQAGLRMMAEPFAHGIERRYPGITLFYGGLICGATFLSEAEKKALSLLSTATSSSAATATTVDTAAPATAV